MKKILSITLALLVMGCMAACKDNKTGENETNKENIATESNIQEKDDTLDNTEENSENSEGSEANSTEGADTKEDSKTNDTVLDEKSAATLVVDGFMGKLCDFDISGMSEYCNVDLVEELGFSDMKSYVLDIIGAELSTDGTGELPQEYVLIVNTMIDCLVDSADYKINSAENKDGKWIFDVTFECVGTDSISETYIQQESEAIVTEIMTKYESELAAAETDEQMNELVEKIMQEVFQSIAEVVKDAFESAEPIGKPGQLVVINQDGKWVVDGNDGNIDAFAEIF